MTLIIILNKFEEIEQTSLLFVFHSHRINISSLRLDTCPFPVVNYFMVSILIVYSDLINNTYIHTYIYINIYIYIYIYIKE